MPCQCFVIRLVMQHFFASRDYIGSHRSLGLTVSEGSGFQGQSLLVSVLQMSWASGNLWRNPLHKKWLRCKTKVREFPSALTLISFWDCLWRLWTKHDCLRVKYSCFSLHYFVVFSILTFDGKIAQISWYFETKVLFLLQSSRALLRSMSNLF